MNGSQRVARLQGEAGATGAEYALILTFFVVIAIGATKYLTRQANSQVDNQAECVSRRPPPPSCQVRAIQTTTTTISGSSTVTTVGSVTTSSTAPPTQGGTPQAAVTSTKGTSGAYATVTPSVTVKSSLSGNPPVPNATVRFRIRTYAPGAPPPGFQESTVTCVSNASGQCTVATAYVSPYNDATKIEITVVQVTATPPFTIDPTSNTITCGISPATACA